MEYESAPRRSPRPGVIMLNLLTAVMVLTSLCVGGAYVALFLNPQSAWNPWPPATYAPTLGPPTATATPNIYLPPTWTPTSSVGMALPDTPTPPPASTPVPPPPTAEEPLPTATAVAMATTTPDSASFASFDVQPSTPIGMVAWFNLPTPGCNYMGVGGQVFDFQGAPKNGLIVRLGGMLEGQSIDSIDALTRADAPTGPGGYLFDLAAKPIASDKTLWVQLFDPQTGEPLSESLYLTTYDQCEANLVLVNWRQMKP